MSRVGIIYGTEVREMVRRLLEAGDSLAGLHPGDRVVIKPNLVVSRRDWRGVNTDPRVVEAIVTVLKDRGVSDIVIGDGSGMGYSATKAFTECGYAAWPQRYGIRLVDLERDRFVDKPVAVPGPFTHLQIAATVLDCDFFIDVPVVKAHSQTRLTCSLKNLKGTMPRSLKTGFHGVDLHRAIAQLASVLRPDLVVADGLQGDLTSETGRTPVAMEMILVGDNPVAVDSVAADILGYRPEAIKHIAHSAATGLGPCDLDRIALEPLNAPTIRRHFTPPPHYTERFPCDIQAEGACCTCLGNVIFALERLKEEGLLAANQTIVAGQRPHTAIRKKNGLTVAVGRCAADWCEAHLRIGACPPTAGLIQRRLAAALGGQAE
jgi:uncharacterized protein (DUF362 family)